MFHHSRASMDFFIGKLVYVNLLEWVELETTIFMNPKSGLCCSNFWRSEDIEELGGGKD